MTDKERILTQIIARSSSESRFPLPLNSIRWEYVNNDTILIKGDIVCGKTNPNHEYGVSFFVERTGNDELVVQEIGSNKQCNYSNEMFMVLRNFPESFKLCGDEYVFYLKLMKVLHKYNLLRFYRINFHEGKIEIVLKKRWSEDLVNVLFEYKSKLSNVTQKSIKNAIGSEN